MGVTGFDNFPRLQSDLGRLSTGVVDRIVSLPTEPSGSAGEEHAGWSEGEGSISAAAAAAAAAVEPVTGPFTDTALVMARLRLPNMELGFEEDGFFGIDVRSLIIGKEIARGAYGVVHEGVLLDSCPSEENEGPKGEEDNKSGVRCVSLRQRCCAPAGRLLRCTNHSLRNVTDQFLVKYFICKLWLYFEMRVV